MAVVRIWLDGYSLLHHWPELEPGWPRHSAVRDELVRVPAGCGAAIHTPVGVLNIITPANTNDSVNPARHENAPVI